MNRARFAILQQQLTPPARSRPAEAKAAPPAPGWDRAFARAAAQEPAQAPTWAAAFARTSGQGA